MIPVTAVISSENRARGIFWRISAVSRPIRSWYVCLCVPEGRFVSSGQISLFARLLWFAINRSPSAGETEKKLSGPQAHMLARIDAGLLHEAWRFISGTLNRGTELGKEYIPLLSPQGAAALDALNKQFSRSGLLAKIRNEVGFHNPRASDLEAGFRAAADDPSFDDEWCLYSAGTNWGTYNAASEIAVLHAMLKLTGDADLTTAHRIMDESRNASGNMITLFDDLTRILVHRYFGPEPHITTEEIEGTPRVSDVRIPFFVDIDPVTHPPSAG